MAPRILFWSELFRPYVGGAEVLADELLPSLSERGYKIDVVTSHDFLSLNDLSRADAISIHRFDFRRALRRREPAELLQLTAEVRALVQRLRPDLVHINGVGPSTALYWAACGSLGIPAIVTLHTEPLTSQRNGNRSLFAESLARAEWITAVSKPVLTQALDIVPEIGERSDVIYNFVRQSETPIRPIPFHPPQVLCIGRMIRDKRFDLALRAFRVVHDQVPDARLVLAGDGPERENLSRLATELGISERVEFTGWLRLDEVDDIIDSGTVLVVTSRREGLPLTAIQAALRGRPIVATPAGGMNEIVRSGRTGVLVDHDDVTGLANAIHGIITRPELAHRFGRAAVRHAGEKFRAETCTSAYDALYTKLLDARTETFGKVS